MTDESTVTIQRQDAAAILTLDGPAVRNALSGGTLTALVDRLREAEHDPGVRVVVLIGAGEQAFSAGGDIRELPSRDMFTELGERARLMREACTLLETMPKPTVAAINGVAAGGGCELALACDIRVASATARLGLPEVNLGLLPGGGGTQRLLRLCGRGVAAELMMTGRLIDADEARRVGLVNHVRPLAELMPFVLDLAVTLAAKGPFALAAIKDALRAGANVGQAEGILYENKLFALCMETDDRREGVAAFLEKRAPAFKGR